ncbi:MAG: hypothetical protein GY861_15175 [bacterium]|nr:hypothetical protein [bacterium]
MKEGKYPTEDQLYKWIQTVGDQLELDNNGILTRRTSAAKGGEIIYGPRQIFVPEKQRSVVLKEAHTMPGGVHPNEQKTLQRLRAKFFWPQMSGDVHNLCKMCKVCIKQKGHGLPICPPLKLILPPKEPMELVSLDVLKLPLTSSGNKRALVAVDYLSKLTWFEPMKREDTVTVSKTFAAMFKLTSCP